MRFRLFGARVCYALDILQQIHLSKYPIRREELCLAFACPEHTIRHSIQQLLDAELIFSYRTGVQGYKTYDRVTELSLAEFLEIMHVEIGAESVIGDGMASERAQIWVNQVFYNQKLGDFIAPGYIFTPGEST